MKKISHLFKESKSNINLLSHHNYKSSKTIFFGNKNMLKSSKASISKLINKKQA